MKEKILEILSDINPDVDFENEKALIDDGILDSFAVIQTVTNLMDAFDIFIDADDIEPENLNSVDAIVELVTKKLEEA